MTQLPEGRGSRWTVSRPYVSRRRARVLAGMRVWCHELPSRCQTLTLIGGDVLSAPLPFWAMMRMTPLRRLIDDFLEAEQAPYTSQQFQQRLVGISRLLDVTSVLAAEIDPTKILETITDEARNALNCQGATLYRYDPLRHELVTSVTTKQELTEIRRPASNGISGYAAEHRQVVNVPHPLDDPRWSPQFDQLTGFVTRNILAAPLIAPNDGALLGVLQLLNREGGPFDAIDEELVLAFSQHAAVALDRARLVQEFNRQQELRASLNVAREIQRSFMPHELPNIERYEAATWWFPNEEVGGDYCDLVRLKDGRVGLVVADVSGHGLGPSLLMASVRAALHALVLEHSAPEVLLNLLDRSLRSSLHDGRFITMVLAVLNAENHCLEYANAGHAPALHYEAATREFYPLEATGMPLGVLERPEYAQGWPIELAVGDMIVLGTDGIIEAMDSDDRQFGQHRLEQLIAQAADQPVREIVELLGSEVEAHYEGEHPPDDLTVLMIRRNR